MKDKQYKENCRYYKGNKPCKYHKNKRVECSECNYYEGTKGTALIVKLGAKGDVLRTTSLLPGLKEKHLSFKISWLVNKGNEELLYNISYIDEIIEYDGKVLPYLLSRQFDIIYNLDFTKVSSGLAEIMNADDKKGFGMKGNGAVYPFNKKARKWFDMSMNDKIKKENKKSYQYRMSELMNIPFMRVRPIVKLTPEEKKFASEFAFKNGIKNERDKIAIILGAGRQWKHKNWPVEKYIKLIKKIVKHTNAKVIIFGGRKEKTLMLKVQKECPSIINSGFNNSLREYLALADLVDIFVTPDSLGLHVSLALDKYTIALFGPTSSAEIDMFDKGTKIIPEKECLACYNENCSIEPNCMEEISIEEVYCHLGKILEKESK